MLTLLSRHKYILIGLVCLLAIVWFYPKSAKAEVVDLILQKLLDGNKNYVAQKMKHPNQSTERRKKIAKGQSPIAVIVSCSDSRVPPEILFDQGLGDLFVVRTAGHVVKDVEIGSIEYAVEHLGTPLIVVLGHKKCGAVEATLKGGEAPGKIGSIVELIKPAVAEAKKKGGDNLLQNAIEINIRMTAEKIHNSKIVKELVEENKVKIIEAFYDIDSGEAKIIE